MTTSPPTDPIAFQFFNEIGIIEHLSRTLFERVMPFGLSVAQFSVLNHFVRLGGTRAPSQLARAFQVTKGAMTFTLQRLEAHGFVAIAADPADGRGKLVEITSSGVAARNAAIAALAPMLAELAQEVPEHQLAEALPALRRVRALLDAARD